MCRISWSPSSRTQSPSEAASSSSRGSPRRIPLSHQSPDPGVNSLIDRLDRLYPAVVSDVLDRMGYRAQAMPPQIRPLFPEARLCARAMPVLAVPAYSVPGQDRDKLELEAVEYLSPAHALVGSSYAG